MLEPFHRRGGQPAVGGGHGSGCSHGVRPAGRQAFARSIGPRTSADCAGRMSGVGIRARLRSRNLGLGAQRSFGSHRQPSAVSDARTRRQPDRVRSAHRIVGVPPPEIAAGTGTTRTTVGTETTSGTVPRGRGNGIQHPAVGGPVASSHPNGRVLPAEHVPGRRAGHGRAQGQHAARVLRGELHGGDQRGGQLRQPVLRRVREAHMRQAQGYLRRRHGGRLPPERGGRADDCHGEKHPGGATHAGGRAGHGRTKDDRPAFAARRTRRNMRDGAHEELRLPGCGTGTRRRTAGRGEAHLVSLSVRALYHEPVESAHTHVPSTVRGQRRPAA